MTDPTRSATYLEFVGGSASKFYAAVIEPREDGLWRVSFNFGRIGSPRPWDVKVDAVDEAKAQRAFDQLIEEKARKGYERRPWPEYLELPGGGRPEDPAGDEPTDDRGLYRSAIDGQLPAEVGGSVGDIRLPSGRQLQASRKFGPPGPRGETPVMWVSAEPVPGLTSLWKSLAGQFAQTGLWPLAIEPTHGIDRMTDVLMDVPRTLNADPFQLLRKWWHETIGEEEDEYDEETIAPFGRKFPGIAPRSPGQRPPSIEPFVPDLDGHLGLVAVRRPSRVLETIGWMGPANYDMSPTEQSAILDTWEDRFDAYICGLGFDTVILAVGRPPQDANAALAIAAEYMAFCSDSVYQGAESIANLADGLIGTHRWDFWWD